MVNTPPNTTSNNNASETYCTDELQVTDILHQTISPEERTITPALFTEPITTEVIAVETDPVAPAECPSSDSEAPVDEDLELMCAEEEQTITPVLSTAPHNNNRGHSCGNRSRCVGRQTTNVKRRGETW